MDPLGSFLLWDHSGAWSFSPSSGLPVFQSLRVDQVSISIGQNSAAKGAWKTQASCLPRRGKIDFHAQTAFPEQWFSCYDFPDCGQLGGPRVYRKVLTLSPSLGFSAVPLKSKAESCGGKQKLRGADTKPVNSRPLS